MSLRAAAAALLLLVLAAGLPVAAHEVVGENSELPDCGNAQPGDECRHSSVSEPHEYRHINYWSTHDGGQDRTTCKVHSASAGCRHTPPKPGYVYVGHTDPNSAISWTENYQSRVLPPATPAPTETPVPPDPDPTPAPAPAPDPCTSP